MTESDKHDMAYLPVESLVPNGWNVQEQDEETFNRLVDEIRPDNTGFIEPVVVLPMADDTYRIISGQHRWMAAKQADYDEIPCLILRGEKWQDEDLQKFVTVRVNVLKGKTNPEKFRVLHDEMAAKYGADAIRGLMGFVDQKAFSKLVDGVKKGMRKSLPKELSAEFDRQAKEAKSVEDLQRIIQTLFTKYGDTLNQSFMIFTHGTQQHLYIAMDRKMSRAMNKVVGYCKTTGEDINVFMTTIVNACVKEVTAKLGEGVSVADPLKDEPEPTEPN